MFDGRIAQSLDRHGDKRRGATAHGTAHKQQTRIELDHRAKLSKQTEHRGTLLIAKRGSLLAGVTPSPTETGVLGTVEI